MSAEDAKSTPPDDDEPAPDVFPDAMLAVLTQRMAETKQSEEDEQVERMMKTAANWRTGRCAQRAVVVLDEWIRRLHCQNGVLACGTYSGEVQTFDIESGDMLDSWIADLELDEDDEEIDQEITAICLSEDARYVLSGDAAGSVLLRQRGEDDPRLSVSHGAAISGVLWDGESRAYSTGLDGRFTCHDIDGSKVAMLQTKESILCMSACDNYCALGLSDGTVILTTLSPMRELFRFTTEGGPASAVNLISPSSLMTGSADGTVRLWRLDEPEGSERRCTTFEGHRGPVVCIYGDGDKVVSGARDGTVRVWDAATAKVRFELRGFTAYLGSLQVADSWMLADGTNNAVLKIDFSEEALLAQEAEEEDGESY